MTLPPERIGDKGQPYQVEGLSRYTGKWEVVGWTDQPDGGSIAEGTRLWPKFKDTRVIDRSVRRQAEREDEAR